MLSDLAEEEEESDEEDMEVTAGAQVGERVLVYSQS